jgi:hypothetical protein
MVINMGSKWTIIMAIAKNGNLNMEDGKFTLHICFLP